MSGIRQHILPRFLLKGFASRIQDEKIFTWVYRKGISPFETTIENVSVEKHFYGKKGEISADDEITKLESNYAHLIDGLRAAGDKNKVSDSRVADFVAHLSVRTKHVRQFFRESTEYILDQLTDFLTDFANLKSLLLGNPKLMQEELTKLLKDMPIEQWQKDALLSLVEVYAPVLLDEQRPELEMLARTFMSQIKEIIPKAVNDGHIKALAKNPVPKPRVDEYKNLTWYVCDAPHSLVLGDAGCLFEIADKGFRPMDDKGDEIINIFLPISSYKVLLGTSFPTVPKVDFGLLNTALARCSYEYFVCSEPSSARAALASSIGRWSGVLTKNELERFVSDILSDARKGGLEPGASS